MSQTSSATGPLVAVTGGAGFIGSHTVDRLIDRGCRVVVLDNLSTGKRENLARWAGDPRLELVVANVADGLFAPLAAVTRRLGPVERIVHLAAQVSVVHSLENPFDDVRTNYGGTVAVAEYARATGVRKVVFSSSAAVYGDVSELPVREDARTQPISPYGIDKYASELFLQYNSLVHGVPATAFRFFNVYGPRQDPKSPYSGVISIFADRATAGRDLTIFGDGAQTRDFVSVDDISSALVTACLGDAGDRAVMNLGTGRETSVLELARVVIELCGSASKIVHAPPRGGEILRSVASIERAAQILAFQPRVALADGLRATLAWMKA